MVRERKHCQPCINSFIPSSPLIPNLFSIQSGLSRKPTKRGIRSPPKPKKEGASPEKKPGLLRRVFSFKKNKPSASAASSSSDAAAQEEAGPQAKLTIGMMTELGFNHAKNEDRGTYHDNLFEGCGSDLADGDYVGTSESSMACVYAC